MRRSTDLVNPPLDDQPSTTSRHKLLKHLLKVFRDLLKRPLDSFVLALIKDLHKLLDRFRRFVEVFTTFEELISLFCKVAILLECLLVDMCELLEAFVDRMQFFDQLQRWVSTKRFNRPIAYPISFIVDILFKRLLRKNPEITNTPVTLVFACCEH